MQQLVFSNSFISLYPFKYLKVNYKIMFLYDRKQNYVTTDIPSITVGIQTVLSPNFSKLVIKCDSYVIKRKQNSYNRYIIEDSEEI
jgi:hypothetical protein